MAWQWNFSVILSDQLNHCSAGSLGGPLLILDDPTTQENFSILETIAWDRDDLDVVFGIASAARNSGLGYTSICGVHDWIVERIDPAVRVIAGMPDHK